MNQAYIATKPIKTRKREYRIGDKIETSNEDVIRTLIEQEAILSLRQAFEEQFKSFSQWLLDYPLNFQALKENRPAIYEKLMELNRQIDRHWLKEDYPVFIKAIEAYKEEHLKFIKSCLCQ